MTLTTLRLSKSGKTVAYSDDGVGEPLVLLHGVGMQSAAWDPQIADLQKDARVIALDLPGHGRSDPLPSDSTLMDYVAWCDDAITTLDIGPVNLAGHSMGALIAGGYAIEHPKTLRRVALLNGVFNRDTDARKAVEQRAKMILEGHVDLSQPLTRWFEDTAEDAPARAMVAAWLGAVNLDAYGTAYSAFAHGDATYAAQFNKITCPFLALTGDDDKNSTPAMAQAMASQVQNGISIAIKGHRHMANLTAADQVTAHLRDWLARPETSEGKP